MTLNSDRHTQTRRERFLIEMDQVVPWKGLIALIEPHYPKGEGGRPPYPLMAILRMHLMQNWFGYSDPEMEESLYETTILRHFAGLCLECCRRRIIDPGADAMLTQHRSLKSEMQQRVRRSKQGQ